MDRKGKVLNENGKSVLSFDRYAETVARKEALQLINSILRRNGEGTIKIEYPKGNTSIITIKEIKK